MRKIKKVLVLGSGALKIGEAGEFDYSGSQAIKALKEEGIEVILVNPNIATIQTSKLLADRVYFLPVNPFFVERIIEKERPDSIFLSFGGQTALNCGLELNESGVLKKYNVEVLGTPVSTIELTEDRKAFAKHLHKIDISTPISKTALTTKEALVIAKNLGYPVMVRSGFSLGGQGSGIADNEQELRKIADHAFSFVKQILVEQYLHHYKEVEYEVVRDKFDNCVTVCNMENMDPLGIHTGESVVIAPSQTLTNFEYHSLRSIAIKIVRSLGVVGECNVQFALNPKPRRDNDKMQDFDYYVIEMNARLSRSSALASKATGYPLAYVAAKLALGKNLTELTNKVTQTTQFCFEPALDYLTVKIPRWDLNKFKKADNTIGSSMKSVGEVMGIGRTFEEAYQKAIRMLDLDFEGAIHEPLFTSKDEIRRHLKRPTPNRMFAIAHAFILRMTVEEVHELTGIDPWFLYRIQNIVQQEKELKLHKKLTRKNLLSLKQIGTSDKRIGSLIGKAGLEVRDIRKKLGIIPSIFQIDTLAGEFPAQTNYLYMTYNGSHNDIKPLNKKGVIVLGSGPYRIGSSVEFDWTSVTTVLRLKHHNKSSIVINCNPETVSTDYDISDRLYFEELTFERIADIYDFESSFGIIVSMGGQTPNNRARALKAYGASLLGTDPDNIDRAENRTRFSALLDELKITQPPWDSLTTISKAISFSKKVGFPVLIRPSYVLSGQSMKICHSKKELSDFLKEVASISQEYPVTISKFIEEAKEIEVDCVAERGIVKALVVSEHVEHAGVHSGDATVSQPAQRIYLETLRKIRAITKSIAQALDITGPFNIQCLAKDNRVAIIEVNLRASRTFPFISKVIGTNLIEMATDAFFDKDIEPLNGNISDLDFVAVKAAQFSFARIAGADPTLGVEMASTGEVACFGDDVEEAFLKAELSVGVKIPEKGVFISIGGEVNKYKFLEEAINYLFSLDLPIFATDKTAKFLHRYGIPVKRVYKLYETKTPNVIDYFRNGKIDLVINIPDQDVEQAIDDGYLIRRAAIDNNLAVFTNKQKAILFLKAITEKKIETLPIKAWDEYK
jgi:carbamoyl-phosphate synthase large subunit